MQSMKINIFQGLLPLFKFSRETLNTKMVEGKVINIRQIFSVAILALGITSSPAMAATYNIVGGFSGGQLGNVAFDIKITNDFPRDSNIAYTTNGLTVISLTSSVFPGQDPFPLTTGSLGYSYDSYNDHLKIGGSCGSGLFYSFLNCTNETDFTFGIFGALDRRPLGVYAEDSLATKSRYGYFLADYITSSNLPGVVPLPAGVILLFSGLMCFGGLRLGRKKTPLQS